MIIQRAEELGYRPAKILANGEVAGIIQMLFTWGLFVGIDEHGYRTRFCYPTRKEAETALLIWDGLGDPPGPWIKEKGLVERMNPIFSNHTAAMHKLINE